MSKIANMLKLIKFLEDGKIHSIKEISKQLEISERMVRVYKQELEQAGIYINSERGIYGGYILDNNLNNIDIGLTLEDLEKLNSIKDEIKDLSYNKIIQKIDNAYIKNKNIMNSKKLFELNQFNKDFTKTYKDIKKAIDNRNKVLIKYKSINSKETERIIHPAEMFNYITSWYVAAFCEFRKEIRLFKLDDILEYKILDEKYSKDFKIKK